MTFDAVRRLRWHPPVFSWNVLRLAGAEGAEEAAGAAPEDDDSLVMPGVHQDERATCWWSASRSFLLHRSLPGLSDGADSAVGSKKREPVQLTVAAAADGV